MSTHELFYHLRKPATIAILGIDGSGKTTQLRRLRAYLFQKGAQVEMFRATSWCREVAHRIARSEGHLNAYELFPIGALTLAGALEHFGNITKACAPDLATADGLPRFVLFDKWVESFRATAAVQGQCDFGDVDVVFRRFPKLDVKFYLRIPLATSLQRLSKREGGLFENENPETMKKLKDRSDEAAESDPSFIIIDGGLPTEAVHEQIWAEVEKHWGEELAGGA